MLNMDQARAGGEGMVGVKKSPKGKDKNVELEEESPVLQCEEKELKIAVPDGWSVKEE
jgi:hypothetical protein